MSIRRLFLWSRYLIGAVWQRQEITRRRFPDGPPEQQEQQLADAKRWVEDREADGWHVLLMLGDSVWMRKFVDRWPKPQKEQRCP